MPVVLRIGVLKLLLAGLGVVVFFRLLLGDFIGCLDAMPRFRASFAHSSTLSLSLSDGSSIKSNNALNFGAFGICRGFPER